MRKVLADLEDILEQDDDLKIVISKESAEIDGEGNGGYVVYSVAILGENDKQLQESISEFLDEAITDAVNKLIEA